jgi:hypothetical protein
MMSEEPKNPEVPSEPDADAPDESGEPDDEGYYDPAPKFDRTVAYMETEKGHEVTLRIVTLIEQLSPAINKLLEAKIEGQLTRPRLDFRKWVVLIVVRLLVFVIAVGALIYMRKVGSIDPAIALLIGGLVAYFFGYNRSQF